MSKGRTALVDLADFEVLGHFNWHLSGGRGAYVCRNVRVDGKQRKRLLHREIMGLPDAPRGVYVDHINGDVLDNRRANLRLCNSSQNQGNRRFQGGASRYRGVTWQRQDKVWLARIKVNGRTLHLGRFKDEHEAARVYNAAALRHFGEFARLNDVDG